MTEQQVAARDREIERLEEKLEKITRELEQAKASEEQWRKQADGELLGYSPTDLTGKPMNAFEVHVEVKFGDKHAPKLECKRKAFKLARYSNTNPVDLVASALESTAREARTEWEIEA